MVTQNCFSIYTHIAQSGSRSIKLHMHALKEAADGCRTPKQFHNLLHTQLRRFVPWEKFAGSWGYPSKQTLSYVVHYNVPLDFMRWYWTTGAQWTSPTFRDWWQNQRPTAYVWVNEALRLKVQETHPEFFRRVHEIGMAYTMVGGRGSPSHYIALCAAMPSEESARNHLPIFEEVLPWLIEASQRAYPRSLLTVRETAVLKRRALGEIGKQIALGESMTERTVRKHLEQIKKKLNTDDLVNAVVIASHSGMIPFEK